MTGRSDAMNWPRLILDGLTGSMLFNAVAIMGFLLVPQAYSTMFPKEIKKAAAPYVDRKDVRTMNLILYPLYLILFVWWGISSHLSGISGFWILFRTGYVEMTFVSVTDFLILDCWLPPRVRRCHRGAKERLRRSSSAGSQRPSRWPEGPQVPGHPRNRRSC